MTQNDRDCLIVAFALDTAGGKAMPQSMEADTLQAQLFLKPMKVIAVIARLKGLPAV